MNKKQKKYDNWRYLYPKHEVSDFTNNYITSLLDTLCNENKDTMIMGYVNINLINYSDDRNTGNFLVTMFSQIFHLTLQHPLELQEKLKHLLIASIITRLSIVFLETKGVYFLTTLFSF